MSTKGTADDNGCIEVPAESEQFHDTLVEEPVSPPEVTFDFVDHFSLKQPSSTVRTRTTTATSSSSANLRVYELANDQLHLEHAVSVQEEDASKVKIKVTMQRLRGGSIGLRFLRTIYTLVALLMAGFLFVFACHVIVMQAMEIPRNSGQRTGESLNVHVMCATIFSLPLLVYTMASLMVLATVFVCDTWNGHVLYALLISGACKNEKFSQLAMDWFCFLLYLGVPVVTLAVASFAGSDNWDKIGALTLYAALNISFVLFCMLVFYHEMKLCLDLTKIYYPTLSGGALAKQALFITLTQKFSGVQSYNYLVHEDRQDTFDPMTHTPVRQFISLYSWTTKLAFNPFFYQLDPPHRRYSIEEIRETVPIVTKQSWSLEKMCCKLRSGRSRFVLSGPNALERHHFQSTLVCTALGSIVGVLFVMGFLYGIVPSPVVIVAVAVLGIFVVAIPCTLSSLQVLRATDHNNSDALYQAWASYTIAKPHGWYCWFRFVIAVVFFFVWPIVTMFTQGLYKLGVVFVGCFIFSFLRWNLDAGSIINEHGSLSDVEFSIPDNKKSPEKKFQAMVARARASEVIGKITSSTRVYLYMVLFGIMGIYFIYLTAAAIDSGEDDTPQGGRPPIRLLDDFYYAPKTDSILYPNCKQTTGFALPGLENTYTMDYNFLAGIAYEKADVTDYILDKWFLQEDFAIDETSFVKQWRIDSGNDQEQVSFKLFSFPSLPGVGVLSIRGTETPLDNLFNYQLYMGTMLTMLVRAFMPFSWLWDGIYPELVATTTWVASDHLKETEYYRITTDFANDLLRNNYTGVGGKSFNFLRTTGVSLGGGLALITGAQTDAYGIAVAGPNPTLARLTFEPPISMDQLKRRVYNLKPENDITSFLGDVVPNHQIVECRTWPNNGNNCHSFWRIFCEYLYSCGSPEDRAGVLCACVEQWGYPTPIAKGNRTFAQACIEEEANVRPFMSDEV